MKKTTLLLSILFCVYFVLCFISTLFFYNWDHFFYLVDASRILNGQKFGTDFIDTKFATFYYLYALFLKLTTGGIPYYPFNQDVFFLIVFSLSSFLIFSICKKLYKNNLVGFAAIFLYMPYIICHGPHNSINTEALQNVFVLTAISFFINKKGELGNRWFLVGLFIAFASFIRFPAFTNYGIVILFWFFIHYNNKFTFVRNIKHSFFRDFKPFFYLTLGLILPWMGYLLYIILTHQWLVISNYIAFAHGYLSIGWGYEALFVPYQLVAHTLFILGFFILLKEKNFNLKPIFFFFLLFFFNLLFNFLNLSNHFDHYYISVSLAYVFIIAPALIISFTHIKNTFVKLRIFSLLYIGLFFVFFLWVGFIKRYPSFSDSIGYLKDINNALKQKGYTFRNYLEEQHVWYRKGDLAFHNVVDLLKQYYHTDTEKSLTLLSNLNNIEITVAEGNIISTDLDFTEYLHLNPCHFTDVSYNYDREFFYKNLPKSKYFSKKILMLTYQKDLKPAYYEQTPLANLLITNNWEGRYKPLPVVEHKLKNGVPVYFREWDLI